ncbi:MAG TPA: class I SAM-dependent methyltransferase [Devosia sp.]|nr:class I SAM-dependent methyltransferase [Devosia sp.]
MSENGGQSGYVLGHSERELKRLEAQAGFYAEATRDGLLKAGIAPGMRVLDLGTGVGDVALIAAEIVGSAGAVTGIDISDGAVAIAGARAAQKGLKATFQKAAIDSFESFADYDAVVGRFILVHFPDPVGVVRAVAGRMKKGAPFVSMEMDMSTGAASAAFPLFDLHLGNIRKMYATMGLSPDMGMKLHGTFRAAGLTPTIKGFTRVGNREEAAGFDFLTESVRSLMPALEKLGIATPADIDIDTLSTRLAAEAMASDPAIFYPRFVVAWAHA